MPLYMSPNFAHTIGKITGYLRFVPKVCGRRMPSPSSKESMLLELNDRATKNLTCLQLVTSVVGPLRFVACGHQFVERELAFPV